MSDEAMREQLNEAFQSARAVGAPDRASAKMVGNHSPGG